LILKNGNTDIFMIEDLLLKEK